jgi:hypothetical protein
MMALWSLVTTFRAGCCDEALLSVVMMTVSVLADALLALAGSYQQWVVK